MMRIYYHGTCAENAESILKTGFRARTWYARSLQDALEYGGPHVFSIMFPFEAHSWQFTLSEVVPVDRIVEYAVIDKKVIQSNKALRKMVFESNC